MSLYDWSTTAADNDDADGNINWLEGQNANTVNNSNRAVMAAIAAFLAQINGATSSTGSANAYAFASPAGNTITAYAAGNIICFKASFANTASATLNVDTLGAKTLKKYGDTNLAANDIETGDIVLAIYDGTNFQVLSALGNTNVEALAALSGAADNLPYYTSSSAMALAPITSAARSILDDATVGDIRTTLGLAIGTDVQAYDSDLAAIAGLAATADTIPYKISAGVYSHIVSNALSRALIADTTEAQMRGTIGVPENTRNITFGTGAPGVLGTNEVYFRHD